ncbi:hypothetical protein K505DRAFT_375104 [Melanomma pulvis-pyrius CBS 109.77]|uniref:Uncharacterized protein n=1 Tax=Melanomma pulvis-pyrius CBS 109.77 TaxID=1314802 RepID=A0A6A6XBJ7_9PLEO|nr:hypothetical protein K505DRAFT_375104 [Melanomma pulvis-pyrius CBS 109.77]
MSPPEPTKKGKKRARNGKEIPRPQQTHAQQPTTAPPLKNSSNRGPSKNSSAPETSRNTSMPTPRKQKQKQKPQPKPTVTLQPPKLARLPDHATVTTRPLHRAALPTPFSSSASPKVLYVTSSGPFIPCIKRVRSLLSSIAARDSQSVAATSRQTLLQANGRLDPRQVERSIAEAASENKSAGGERGEEVFVKGSGKAIERVLEIGVYFQKERDCRVRVEIASVRAIDDIELGKAEGEVKHSEEGSGGGGGVMEVDVDQENGKKERKKKRKGMRDEDVPETRIRTLSVVTVAISLK